ncbi:MAG: hypothetical protein JWR21_640 [Herminiimonas sp.]|nr:hypothetical protein [Herminiimonas sp.]
MREQPAGCEDRFAATSDKSVLLQFLAQGIAIDSKHFSGVRLVTVSPCHDGFEDRSFDREDHHLIDVRRLLLTEIPEVFFEAFLDDVLDRVFAHF